MTREQKDKRGGKRYGSGRPIGKVKESDAVI